MTTFLKELFAPLFGLMAEVLTTFHGWGAPWWLSIIMLTVVVRSVLLPLTLKQVKSMRAMQDLKPEMDGIREKHKDDPHRQQEEMVKLYGERKVNPLGGCLPLLVQMPIFLTLYYTIKQFESLESFRTGGLLWFSDLTIADPYFALPILYVITMLISQEVTIRHTDPQQKQLMRIMPIAFGFFLMRFPAGLFVYWVASNAISILQNLLVYRRFPVQRPAEKGAGETRP
jgi:YidC/Oxa1 family membrane protein insertase